MANQAPQSQAASPKSSSLPSPSYLVDGVSALAIHNGVARIQFMKLGRDGQPEPSIELCVPVVQLKSLIEVFTKASKG